MLRNGIDLVEIERIRQSSENPAFMKRVYGEQERAQFSEQKHPEAHLAGAFAAKEAFSKAIKNSFNGRYSKRKYNFKIIRLERF